MRSTFHVREDYTGTGTLSVYTFDFKLERAKDILILHYDQDGVLLNQVRGNEIGAFLQSITFYPERDSGGSITLVSNLPSLHRLIILLANDEPTQDFKFRTNFDLSLVRIERAFDWAVGPIQRLAYRMRRVLSFPDTFDPSVMNIQIPPPVAGKVLATKTDGTGFEWIDPLNVEVVVPTLPDGGNTGDLLAKNSDVDQDAGWKSYGIKGFSSRFSEIFDTDTLEETLATIVKIAYSPPTVSLSASGASTLRERGDAVSATTLTATVTKRSDPIASVVFKKDGVVIYTVPTPNPAGGTFTYNWTGTPFSNNSTFTVEVTDDGATGGPTTVTGSATFSFVYPYYHGAGAPALTASQVASLTKSIIANTATLARSFTAANGNVFYFAYPASYGALTSILDINNFETFPDWTLRTENITGLDGNAVSYRIYVFNNPVVAGSYTYTFKR